MVKKGIVKKLIGNQAWVQVINEKKDEPEIQSSSCTCSSCAGCHTQKDFFLVDLNCSVQLEEVIELHFESYRLFILAFVTFILPLIALISSLWISRNMLNSLHKWGLVLSFLAISLLFTYIFDKFYKARVRVVKVLEKDHADE